MNTPRDPDRMRREAVIEAGKSGVNGWRRDTLAEWGVPWPPPPGWKETIIRHGFPYQPSLNKRQIKRGVER